MADIQQLVATLDGAGVSHAAVAEAVCAALHAHADGPVRLRVARDGAVAVVPDAPAPTPAPPHVGDRLTPAALLGELNEFLDDTAIVAADAALLGRAPAGSLAVESGRTLIETETAAALCPTLLGARYAHADREIIGVLDAAGLSAFGAGLRVAVDEDMPIVLLICRTADEGSVAADAETAGWHVQHVDAIEEVQTALAAAFASEEPAAVECNLPAGDD